jgi:hypothetical protein
MSNNPLNLALRFFLELAALFAMGYWGWSQHEGVLRVLLVLGVPIFAATIWGVFRVPNDPRDPPIRVPGMVRLLLEIVFFSAAVGLLFAANQPTTAAIFGGVVLLHYLASYDRILWLLKQ